LIKSLDPNHLVSTGHSNLVNKLADLPIKTIDFGTWHGYAGYEKMSIPQFVDQIHEFCALGAGMNKPVLMEEFGLAGSQPVKLEAYKSWLDALIRDRNCAGWVVWRLVSRQDDGQYPSDHDGFDIHNDGGDLWRGLQLLADETRRAAN
jgi:mannan endo-1,4-beta-mannosidase